MSERVVSRVLIVLSVLLVIAEAVMVWLYGVHLETILLPFIFFLAAVAVLYGLVLMNGMRPEIESVSMRRARAMKDDLVRKRLEGYEVDEEFLPGGAKKKKQRGSAPVRQESTPMPAREEKTATVTRQTAVEDPFRNLDPRMLELVQSFGGFRQMIAAVEAMDAVTFKRMIYSLNIDVVDRDAFLEPLRAAVGKAERGPGELRRLLDHEGMEEYIKNVLAGRDGMSDSGSGSYSLDLDTDMLAGGPSAPPGEFSHDPRSVIDQFKRSLKKS
ncbi:hypothetical protein [Prosthecochloris sp. HL-130-GSB]|jgi:hypothetical protein|uniref:hypothetical protein n=1 Tax=Prosthecochloris sp. HL-130-GSB TaxID=1974213 RepID=UPI000A1C1150|nr:hypothetical protein [Prosthecochloris sp. HL-130-GSB]ARM31511.1 hypothetical protein B9H02_09655 [Prosthecochloris sp. HL-130-GSB]MBO8092808.1 hypothetical protein [Prosthecochloris sp.]